ncbi:hypothetical protein SS7213T_08967, partial [Staphylococcus simiae CCM 7213 = CCUG 51256]
VHIQNIKIGLIEITKNFLSVRFIIEQNYFTI